MKMPWGGNYYEFYTLALQSLNDIMFPWYLVTSWTAARQTSSSFTFSMSLLKFMSIESMMPSNYLILCQLLLLLPSIFPSIKVFFNEWALCIGWSKYWSFSFSISSFNAYSRLIFFNIDCFWSPFCPRDSKESSPTLHFKNINSSTLSFLCSPTLTSIHDYWTNHSFDCMDLFWQSNVSVF